MSDKNNDNDNDMSMIGDVELMPKDPHILKSIELLLAGKIELEPPAKLKGNNP